MNTENPVLADLSVRQCRDELQQMLPGRMFRISDRISTGLDKDFKQYSEITVIGDHNHPSIVITGIGLASCLEQLRRRMGEER